MTLFTGAILYLLIWWTSLFVVLPWGVKPHDGTVEGADAGAPESPNLRIKLIANTALAAFLWLGLYLAITHNIIPFRELAKEISR